MLDYTWNLEKKLKEVQVNNELKTLIIAYIEKFHVETPHRSFSGIVYRGTLHYILDNINKPELINELKQALHEGE